MFHKYKSENVTKSWLHPVATQRGTDSIALSLSYCLKQQFDHKLDLILTYRLSYSMADV